jgi:signal transduction histidine kinase
MLASLNRKNQEESMRRIVFGLIPAALMAASAWAADFGTAAEAKAMLEKAVVAVKADKAAALAQFAKGEGGFKDRDLYPFCGGPDGTFTAHPTLTGKSLKDLKDKEGKPLGEEVYKNAQEGKIAEVSYMWPRPGTTEPLVQKVSFVTKVGDQVCAVGYYK